MKTRLSLVRHGDVHNPEQVFYGRLPGFGLSETGRLQARAAADHLCRSSPSALYTSKLRRARETAAIIQSVHPRLVPVCSPLLLEVRSPYEGTPRSTLRNRDWDLYTGTPSSYEQPADVLARIRQFAARARVEHAGEHVVAVTHGDLIFFLILWAHGHPPDPLLQSILAEIGIPGGYPQPASITTFLYRSGDDDERPDTEHVVPYEL
jgi:broad specificity phosphatase PhoE